MVVAIPLRTNPAKSKVKRPVRLAARAGGANVVAMSARYWQGSTSALACANREMKPVPIAGSASVAKLCRSQNYADRETVIRTNYCEATHRQITCERVYAK